MPSHLREEEKGYYKTNWCITKKILGVKYRTSKLA
jgi:hypothetical protein